MAAVFAFSRNAAQEFCRRAAFRKLILPRPRKFNGHARTQQTKRSGQEAIHSGPQENVSKLQMIKWPLGFTIMTGAVCFVTCPILNYERVRHSYIHGNKSSTGYPKRPGIRDVFNKWWNSLHPGSKTVSVLIFLNMTVFLLWRVPAMQAFMYRWFLTTPGRSITLLTGVFSHMDAWHLACNMLVLWSFAPRVEAILGKEQFLALYLTGGVFASFAGLAYRIATSHVVASLGASGALLAVISLLCIHQPDVMLCLVFLPIVTFPAGKALLGIAAFDLAGLIFRWQLFDHAAHLGGVLFGAWYLKYGHHYLWGKRDWLVSQWHKLREGHKRT